MQNALVINWDSTTGFQEPFEAQLPRHNDPTYAMLIEAISKEIGEADLEEQDRFKMINVVNGTHSTLIEWKLDDIKATTQIIWL